MPIKSLLCPPPPYVLRTELECAFCASLDTPYFRQLARRAQAIHNKLTTCFQYVTANVEMAEGDCVVVHSEMYFKELARLSRKVDRYSWASQCKHYKGWLRKLRAAYIKGPIIAADKAGYRKERGVYFDREIGSKINPVACAMAMLKPRAAMWEIYKIKLDELAPTGDLYIEVRDYMEKISLKYPCLANATLRTARAGEQSPAQKRKSTEDGAKRSAKRRGHFM